MTTTTPAKKKHIPANRRPVDRVVALGVCSRCDEVHERCKAHNRSGKQCRRYAEEAQLVCSNHGGASPQARTTASVVIARQRAVGEAGKLIAEAMGVAQSLSAPEQIVDAIDQAYAYVLAYRWLIDEMDLRAVWHWTTTVNPNTNAIQRVVDVTDDGLLVPNAVGQMTLHPYEEALRHWTNLHSRLVTAAANMGVEERRQALAEEQVHQFGSVIKALVSGLGHTMDDPNVVKAVQSALVHMKPLP